MVKFVKDNLRANKAMENISQFYTSKPKQNAKSYLKQASALFTTILSAYNIESNQKKKPR